MKRLAKLISLICLTMMLSANLHAGEIHDAAATGDLDTVKKLVEADSNLLEAKDKNGNTPLFAAIKSNQVEIVRYLIEHGADIKEKKTAEEGMLTAATKNSPEMIDVLVSAGIDVNSSVRKNNHLTALHWAAIHSNLALTQCLLKHKADVDSRDGYRQTPLHLAAIKGSHQLIQSLVANGADVNAKTEIKLTPLHYLGENPDIESARILIESGARVNVVNDSGETPLLSAIKKGNPALALYLLEHGASLGHKDEQYGRNELHLATLRGYGKVVDELVVKGADINAEDKAGHTPLYYASKYGHHHIADVLLQHGADKQQQSRTPSMQKTLNESLDLGQARIWYTGQSGWIVKTAKHILIFDYWESLKRPDEASLANGYFNGRELNGDNIYLFVSHEHYDHYDANAIQAIKAANPQVKLIFGFKPEEIDSNQEKGYQGPSYEYVGPRESRTIDELNIHTLKSNDSGVAFALEVDGLTIYHSGDHADRNKDMEKAYQDEIEFIANKVKKEVDIAFLGATGCGPWNSKAVEDGFFYTVDRLSAKVVLPMHGFDNENRYKKFAENGKKRHCPAKILCAENKGDSFFYDAH